MSDNYDELIDIVIAIKEDEQLKKCFNHILQFGSHTQQVRVNTLLNELESLRAPDKVKNFVRLLSNDQLAQLVLREINQ